MVSNLLLSKLFFKYIYYYIYMYIYMHEMRYCSDMIWGVWQAAPTLPCLVFND